MSIVWKASKKNRKRVWILENPHATGSVLKCFKQAGDKKTPKLGGSMSEPYAHLALGKIILRPACL